MSTPSPTAAQWLACAASLPTDEPSARMRLLRMLESLGCAILREGVYLLPDTPDTRHALSRLCEHIRRSGGNATMLCVTAMDEQQARYFREQFDRTAKYDALVSTVTSLKAGFGVADPSAISRVLSKQRREFEAISVLDFFPSAAKEKALDTLREAEGQVRALMFPQAGQGTAADTSRSYAGRTWATRLPLWADRLACAWLIRRFIDVEATLVWLEKTQALPAGAVGFGFDGAEFSNTAQEVTFERLMRHFSLEPDPALKRMAGLVHFLEAGGSPVSEAAGVETLLLGAQRRSLDNSHLLQESDKTFDLLYEAYGESRAQ